MTNDTPIQFPEREDVQEDMRALFRGAIRLTLESFLEDHEEGIGTHVSVDHVAPARVGRTVRVVAEAESVAPHKLVCKVTAYEGDRVIGSGRQVQRIQSKQALKELFERI